MRTKTILSLALVLSGGFWTARADEPGPIQPSFAGNIQLEAQGKELCALLVKASSNPLRTHSAVLSRSQPGEFSPNLTEPENARLLQLLRDPKVADTMPLVLALAAVKQRELEGSLPGCQQYDALMDILNRRWPHDPVVIAFCREALATRGNEAIFELWSPLPGIWDDSLLEPVVRLIEKTASWIVIDDALRVLDRHYSVWATNASIPPRLSKAALRLFPSLTNIARPSPKAGDQMWCNAVGMLAKTHDPAMIEVLRPFLKNKVVAGDGLLSIDRTPLRACDEAAIAISSLLGDTRFAEDGMIYSGGAMKTQDNYPKWKGWDRKIGELQKRLDGLPKK
jgi:hypothetical protein